MLNKNNETTAFERCYMAYLEYQKEKVNQQNEKSNAIFKNYMRYKNVGNLIFYYICTQKYIIDKPQSIEEIMNDYEYSYSDFYFYHYLWGYRGTTQEHMQHYLQSYLRGQLGCPVMVICTESTITITGHPSCPRKYDCR